MHDNNRRVCPANLTSTLTRDACIFNDGLLQILDRLNDLPKPCVLVHTPAAV